MSTGLKDKELQEYYEALFEMYGSAGWRELMKDAEYMLRRHDTPRDLVTIEQLHFRRGELEQMDWLATHQQRTEAAYALALEEDGESADNVETGGVAKIVDGPGAR